MTVSPGQGWQHRARLLPAAWIYLGAYALWVVAMLAGFTPRGMVNDFVFLPLYFGAGLAAWLAARVHRTSPRTARGWRLVAAAWLISGVAAIMMALSWQWPIAWLDTVSLALYQLYFPLLLFAFWQFIEFPSRGLARLRLIVEGLIVVVATITLAWFWIFRFDEAAQSPLPYLKILLVMFPGELAVAVGAVAIVHRPAQANARRALSLLSVGTLAAVVADFIYEYDALVLTGWSGPVADLVLGLAATLVISAGLSIPRSGHSVPHPAVAIGPALVPYLATGVVATLAICEWWLPDLLHPALSGLVLGGAVLMGLLILRLLVAQREFAIEAGAREEQDARFRALVQRSSDAILVVCRTGRIYYASPPFGAMIGAPGEDHVGRRLTELIDFDPPEGLEAWLAEPAKRPLVRWRTRDHRDIEALATDHTADPSIGGIVINARDISERTRLEARLQQAQKLEAVGRFASSVAHDFNNVLTVIGGNVHFLLGSGTGHGVEELAQMAAATDRGAALARQLTAMSRPKPRTATIVDLTAVVGDIERTLKVLLPSSIRTTVSAPTTPLIVGLDDVEAEQILLNLALNSRDAMPEGGTLEIRLDADKPPGETRVGQSRPWARLTVRDSGSGMSPEIIAQAFEPFFTTKGPSHGSGLGLSSVQTIVAGAGGQVDLDSRPGAGTTVTIRLPLVVAPESASRALPPPATRKGEGRLLVVDDEPAVRRIVARHLSAAGYQVVEREDGRAALDLLEEQAETVNLVITDLVMPRMSGQELASRIADRWPHLPLLFMSGTPGVIANRSEVWASNPVIAKPLDLTELKVLVAEVLRRELV